MPTVRANNIDIYYEESGPADAPVILLVMGLAAQMTFWPDAMLNELTKAGFRVVRFGSRRRPLGQKCLEVVPVR